MAKPSLHTAPGATQAERTFHVALSFAGEDRDYVEKTARILRSMGFRVFYDKYETVSLWGKNLYDHLTEVYSRTSQYVIMFISKYYAKKLWTNHERQSAQARAFSEQREYILPVRFDDTEIPGVHKTVGYVDLRDMAPADLASLIKEKIGPIARENFMPEDPDCLLDSMRAKTKRDRRLLNSVAQGVFEVLSLMTREERRLLALVAWHTCPNGPDVDGDIHINLELLSRLSGLSRRAILAVCSRIECLGFNHELTAHNGNDRRKNILRITYEPLRVAEELSGNWTSVVFGMFSCLEDNLCPECRQGAVDRMDFSALSTLAGFPDSHGLSGEETEMQETAASNKRTARRASKDATKGSSNRSV